jgi:putative transcriptional regulator
VRNRIRVLRAERDWSQARLAEELEVSRQTVNAIENGRYDPSLPLAFRIAGVFALRIEQIFFPAGAAQPVEDRPLEDRPSLAVSEDWP